MLTVEELRIARCCPSLKSTSNRTLKINFPATPLFRAMLALKAVRSTIPLIARRPLLAAYFSQGGEEEIRSMVDILKTDPHPFPPKAPSDTSYPAPTRSTQPVNPVPNSQKGYLDADIEPLPIYRLHCQATRNNTVLTFTRSDGSVVFWNSGGTCGFKHVNRSGFEAGYQCTVRMFKLIAEYAEKESIDLEIFLKGFGQGRDAFTGALMSTEGQFIRPMVKRLTDRTRLKVGGTRSKKARRL